MASLSDFQPLIDWCSQPPVETLPPEVYVVAANLTYFDGQRFPDRYHSYDGFLNYKTGPGGSKVWDVHFQGVLNRVDGSDGVLTAFALGPKWAICGLYFLPSGVSEEYDVAELVDLGDGLVRVLLDPIGGQQPVGRGGALILQRFLAYAPV